MPTTVNRSLPTFTWSPTERFCWSAYVCDSTADAPAGCAARGRSAEGLRLRALRDRPRQVDHVQGQAAGAARDAVDGVDLLLLAGREAQVRRHEPGGAEVLARLAELVEVESTAAVLLLQLALL